jgi:bile acid:Na+ symporter, BASS family
MFLMDTLSRTLTFIFLIMAMLSIGLQATIHDLRALLKSGRFILSTLLVNFIIVPIIGLIMTRILPLTPAAATALLLLACTPGGISALQFTTKIKGASLYAGSSAFLLSFTALFFSPVLLNLLLPGNIVVVVPYGRALLFTLVIMLLPMAAGMLILDRWEHLAAKLAKVCAIISAILFILVSILITEIRREAVESVGMEALSYMLIFIIVSMAAGWFIGGPQRITRQVSATVTGIRFVAFCLLIARYTFPDSAVQAPLVAFSTLMMVTNTLFAAFLVIRFRKTTQRL